jgi:trigger factor
VTFPENYGQEKLQGVKAVFEVDVKELRKPVVATIDEAFAKTMGFETLAKLEEVLEQQIQKEYDQVARMNVKRNLLDALDEAHTFAVPAGMVEAEFQGIWKQLKGQEGHEGHDHGHEDPNHVHGPDCDHDHGHAHDHGSAEEKAEYHDIAERRVKLGLVLAEVGRINKIEVTNQELQQAVINEARRYPGQERQIFEFYQKTPNALESLKAPIYEDKVVDFVLGSANIISRQVDFEELSKAAEQEMPIKGKSANKASKGSGKTK